MLIEALIAQICGGLIGVDYQACSKALEAASVQSSVKQSVATAEQRATTLVYTKTAEVTGEEVLAVALFTAKITRDKSLTIPLIRNDGPVPAINTSIDQNGGRINFGWRF